MHQQKCLSRTYSLHFFVCASTFRIARAATGIVRGGVRRTFGDIFTWRSSHAASSSCLAWGGGGGCPRASLLCRYSIIYTRRCIDTYSGVSYTRLFAADSVIKSTLCATDRVVAMPASAVERRRWTGIVGLAFVGCQARLRLFWEKPGVSYR